jgi:Asp/Glu/hydantoin racemase
LIHALAESMEPSRAAFARQWPDAEPFDLLDSSLSSDLARAGAITSDLVERFVGLARYAAGTTSAHGPTRAILFTCSAFRLAIDAVKARLHLPVLGPNEAAFERALERRGRIGILVTFPPSETALANELRALAEERHCSVEIVTRVAHGALAALRAGDVDTHDRIAAQAVAQFPPIDSLVLGQFSLARAAQAIEPLVGCEVLTTPDSAVGKLRATVERRAETRQRAVCPPSTTRR